MSRLKTALGAAGSVLGVGGVAFVAVRLYRYSEDIDWSRFGARGWILVGVLALVYGAMNIMLARAWWSLLDYFGAPTRFIWSVRAYGVSQLAKYVPGNIFHLAGRQAIGLAAGLPGWALAKSAMWELGSLAAAGALFGLLLTPRFWPRVPVAAAALAFVVVAALAIAAVRRAIDRRVAVSAAWHAAFLLSSGCLFVSTLAIVEKAPPLLELPFVCGAYVIAWLGGMVTPGAPAGAGVRELIILFILQGRFAAPELVLTVVLLRIVTTVGDVCFFAASSTLLRAETSPQAG